MSGSGDDDPSDIPIVNYCDSNEHHKTRLEALTRFFCESFAQRPEFFVCVPGRVNLIGEHIDYNGYPVLPMAIRQNILLAVSCTADAQLQLRNINSAEFAEYSGDINEFKIDLPKIGKPAWHNYVLCGLKGIRDQHTRSDASQTLHGMRIAVSGNIPAAAGLSSSSALVCAATLAASYANQVRESLDARQLATIAAHCERYIGTEGGGMDQAIAFLAQRDAAMFIDWSPLRASVVRLPPGIVFVIANSMAQANKADTASEFNQRVVECRLACSILAKQQGVAEWREHKLFAKLERTLGCTRAEFSAMVCASFANKSSAYTRLEVLELLGIGEAELVAEYLTENTRDMQRFWLYRRALHVVHERDRVYEFRKAAESHNVGTLGSLMQASHESLSTKYDCSHPCLDRMVELGASKRFASRLTGAGWGGCTVALCESDAHADEYIRLMTEEYYVHRSDCGSKVAEDQMFATSPQGGAVIIVNNVD